MKRVYITYWFVYSVFLLCCGCRKYLSTKPDASLVVPKTTYDLYGLLDYSHYMNGFNVGLGEASSDNYYLSENDWESLNTTDRNMYIWEEDINDSYNEWQRIYTCVYYANVIFDNLENITKNNSNRDDWNTLKGSALFFRSWAFFIALTNWSVAYDSTIASQALGIPLRLNSDFNQPSVRESVKAGYDQIIKDLKASIPLLPKVPLNLMRPSKGASYSLLGRIYLSMGNFEECLLYTDSALKSNSELIDYNTIDSTAKYPFSRFNEEVIFNASGYLADLNNNIAKIDSNLISSYNSDDLRLSLFYKMNSDSSFAFRGSYFSSFIPFIGLATDELYLNKAECLAREGDIDNAMNTLNILLKTRWNKQTFQKLTASSSNEALNIILKERRKELVMRNLRWMDLKRLNREDSHSITLIRKLGGQTYTLPPNDPRYALPIPKDVIEMTGMQQNPR